ncbi:uncharacterized protein [Littorina saxatilis]|uniref:uncharacterized protein n=1 Tax=Littorina saxatilis TaxID=31220 RepID=UPI0038B5126C
MWLILFFWVLQVCSLAVQPYNFTDCINNSLNIFVDGKTRIRCTGLAESQDIFWSISYDNGTELRLADCNYCNNCQVLNNDYKVTRNKTFSVLRLVRGDDKHKDGRELHVQTGTTPLRQTAHCAYTPTRSHSVKVVNSTCLKYLPGQQ